MKINRIQAQIITNLSKGLDLDVNQYLSMYSEKYLGKIVAHIDELNEEDADHWITQTYLESLEM